MGEIELRPWRAEDAAALAALCDAADRRFLSDRLPSPYTAADAEFWLRRVQEGEGRDGLFRAIVQDGAVVGMVSAEQKQDVYRKDAELGYLLYPTCAGRGIMSEAVRQFCPLAFAQLDIVRLTGLVYAQNAASRRVLEKNGFAQEGLLRNAVCKNGALQDLAVYGKLRPYA